MYQSSPALFSAMSASVFIFGSASATGVTPAIRPRQVELPVVDTWSSSRECQGRPGDPYNATFSVEQPALYNTSTEDWTWHTGLNNTGNRTSQNFWVETTGSDLNSLDLPYGICARFFMDLEGIPFEDSQRDDGKCGTALGQECLDAITAAIPASPVGDCGTGAPLDFRIPEECTRIEGNYVSSTFALTQSNVTSGETCGSTSDNANGQNSVFMITAITNTTAPGSDLYSRMANQTYLLITRPFVTEEGTAELPPVQFTCFKNAKFAEGSRNPFPVEQPSQPSPTSSTSPTASSQPPGSSGMRTAASSSGLLMAFFGTVLVLLG